MIHDATCTTAVVIGAGPAGLGASIGLAAKGIEVTVLEQQEHLGSVRRGETIRADRAMEEILGQGLFDAIAIRKVDRRRYYSHTGRCHVDRTIKNPNIIFAWPDLIGKMASVAGRLGVRILTGYRVIRPLEQSGKVNGVAAEALGHEEVFPAGTVFSCGGCSDPCFSHIGRDRTGIDMAVQKRLVTGYTGLSDRLEYHFHLDNEGLVVGTVFPRNTGEAELILLDTARRNNRISFDEFGLVHTCFGSLLEGTQTVYESETLIPMGGMIYPFSPTPGLVMAGDVLGHVQARGGSGIKASFLIGHASGILAAEAMRSGGWTEEKRKKFDNSMCIHPHVRALSLHNLIYSRLRPWIFSSITSPYDMDRKWPFLKIALR